VANYTLFMLGRRKVDNRPSHTSILHPHSGHLVPVAAGGRGVPCAPPSSWGWLSPAAQPGCQLQWESSMPASSKESNQQPFQNPQARPFLSQPVKMHTHDSVLAEGRTSIRNKRTTTALCPPHQQCWTRQLPAPLTHVPPPAR
jgi:hypothetical protein